MDNFTEHLISQDRVMEKMGKKTMSVYNQRIVKERIGDIKESLFLGIILETWKDACKIVGSEPAVKLEWETQDKAQLVKGGGDEAECPVCDFKFERRKSPWGARYCPSCGQRLYWGISKEGLRK